MDEDRERRLALNEALFRDVNERLRELSAVGGIEDGNFVCECPRPECTERIALSSGEYESVRADPTHFVVVPGHFEPEIEDVVLQQLRYWIVAKRPGEPARVVGELDPRS